MLLGLDSSKPSLCMLVFNVIKLMRRFLLFPPELWSLAGGCGRLFHLTCGGLLFINVWDTAQGSNKQHYPYLVPLRLRMEEAATESTAPKWLYACSAASGIFFLN